MSITTFEVQIPGGDIIRLDAEINNSKIQKTTWHIVGRLELLEKAHILKDSIKGEVKNTPIPEGKSPADLMLKELCLKIRGEWGQGPKDPELCHCRKIPQINVERAIILGAHNVEKVRQRSSANTGCGTCLPDVQELLDKYLK